MRNISTLFALLALTLSSQQIAAGEITASPYKFPYKVEVFDLPTSSNGVNYRLFVRAPLREPTEGESASSIYLLDAIANFAPAASMSFNYEHFNYMPASYFIGIGYQNEVDGNALEQNRTRDYTPSRFKPADENHFLSGNPVSYEGSGGADAFLDVVEKQIIPFIQSRYSVDKTDSVLVGSSMSGLLATNALLTRPGLFNRYVIISPSIWWDDWFKPRSERNVMLTAGRNAKTVYPGETRAYFVVGDSEERFGLVTDLYVLVNTLRNSQNDKLKVHLEVLPDELHEGMFPSGFMRGILAVYANEPARRASATSVKW